MIDIYRADKMIMIQDILDNIGRTGTLNLAKRELLHSLSFVMEQSKQLFYTELIQMVDHGTTEKIPLQKKLLNSAHLIGVFPTNITLHDIVKDVCLYITPYLENVSPIASRCIIELFSKSLFSLSKNNISCSNLSRRYLCTDQAEIYRLDFKICYYATKYFLLKDCIKGVFCIVGAKTAVDLRFIDLPSISYFYQRQLMTYGISEKQLLHLYQELKHVYALQELLPFAK